MCSGPACMCTQPSVIRLLLYSCYNVKRMLTIYFNSVYFRYSGIAVGEWALCNSMHTPGKIWLRVKTRTHPLQSSHFCTSYSNKDNKFQLWTIKIANKCYNKGSWALQRMCSHIFTKINEQNLIWPVGLRFCKSECRFSSSRGWSFNTFWEIIWPSSLSSISLPLQ